MKPSLLSALACAAVASAIGVGWAVSAPRDASAQLGPILEAPLYLDAEGPAPTGTSKAKPTNGDEEACKTGCTLAKHDIPPFSFGQFVRARAQYAKEKHNDASKSLETLLFYRQETLSYLGKNGVGPLPEKHATFLKRELSRKTATVSIRVVGANGRTRISLADVVVPLGVKQHLKPKALDGTQPLEFNGTVKRVGLYHLWSRY